MNLADKLAAFSAHWQPRVVGQFNGHDLMVVKVNGEFVPQGTPNTGNAATAAALRVIDG